MPMNRLVRPGPALQANPQDTSLLVSEGASGVDCLQAYIPTSAPDLLRVDEQVPATHAVVCPARLRWRRRVGEGAVP